MIGVISRPDQVPVVKEFFELFKTPWEFYRSGRHYEVVLATDDIAGLNATVLILSGAKATALDARCGTGPGARRNGASLDYHGTAVPLFGSVLTFAATGAAAPRWTHSVVVEADLPGLRVIRVGYDLFDEARFLLQTGQPVESAHVPTLDLHIAMLRDWILAAGVPLVEIPPTPFGYALTASLTHDIDFVGIKPHRLDHSTLGFLYRATIGAVRNFARGRLSFKHLVGTWLAAVSLPLVHLGWVKDFWSPFDWYLEVERGLPATYYLIPFKRMAGDRVPGSRRVAARRATAYDVEDIRTWTAILRREGCELGVHGIDAWHSVEKARNEAARLTAVTGSSRLGIRMHWLLQDATTASVLDQAGYTYDSTVGFNETVGYRAGTSQVFRPLGARTLLELPMHIQDGALFYSQRLDLSEADAWRRCQALLLNAKAFGGVLTLLWHDRSHGPERYWGAFYVKFIDALKRSGAWFGTALQVVTWFAQRRAVTLQQQGSAVQLRHAGGSIHPPLTIRHHLSPTRFVDTGWDGAAPVDCQVAAPQSLRAPERPPIESCLLS